MWPGVGAGGIVESIPGRSCGQLPKIKSRDDPVKETSHQYSIASHCDVTNALDAQKVQTCSPGGPLKTSLNTNIFAYSFYIILYTAV